MHRNYALFFYLKFSTFQFINFNYLSVPKTFQISSYSKLVSLINLFIGRRKLQKNSLEFSLIKVTDSDYSLIQNLIRFYIYDMSEFMGWVCPSTGLFGGVDDQPYYFGHIPENNEALWPEGWRCIGFKIIINNEIAGFCLVRLFKHNGKQLNDIGEFFILRKFRKKGLGQAVSHSVFDMYPDHWQVRQLLENIPAQRFWEKTIHNYTYGQFQNQTKEIDGIGLMKVQNFSS